MSAGFPDLAFCRFAIEAFNAEPDAKAAAAGFQGDFGIVVEQGEATVALYLGAPVDGVLPLPEQVEEVELLDREPAYLARASLETWLELMRGGLDPVAAIVHKRLDAQGDLMPVVARLKFKGLALRWLARINAGG